ncbi:variant leucine-rich repeat-containing protein [Cyanobacterium aponinum]|uniref:Leucine rich repeat variant domain-containing protein n=1 Tax=Cyanobacterium aponinum (strain PCC 10605) TaxID=755178 RepID=K9Z809_CYAAP|nr:hypothetical protein [Cyanobacterium aponinum]AFZ54695.1 hypothetical protein Cyan10605_2620 [Cyanobacterium aponinum PCC 10605]
MTDNKKATKHSTTETNINVEGLSEIILECYKKNNKLKIRVISEGYDSELNVRFPRDLREEGALYSVETIEKTKGNYYLVKGNITKIDQDLDSVIAKNSDLNNEQSQTILTEEKTLKETTTPQDLTELANERAEASGETTTSERLKELANKSIELACLVAQNPHCPSDLLAELAHNEDRLIRQAVTNNPNTPKNTLLKLGTEFPEELLDNPIFDLLLLENPNLLAEMPTSTLKSMVKIETVPNSFLNWAVNYGDDEVLIALLSNPQLSQEDLVQLTKHKNPQIVEEAKLHINWNEEIENPEEFIRKALRYNNLSSYMLREELEFFVNYFFKEMISSQWGYDLLFSNKNLRISLASNPNTPVRVLEKLATDDDKDVRRSVAENPNTPVTLSKKLGIDYIFRISEKSRRPDLGCLAVFLSPYAETSHLAKNFRSTSWLERWAIAQNPNTPENTLSYLVQDGNRLVRSAAELNIKQRQNGGK